MPTQLLMRTTPWKVKGKRMKGQEQPVLANALRNSPAEGSQTSGTAVTCNVNTCSTSLNRFNIVQAQHRKIWETHLLFLAAATVIYSGLKRYYTAKYRSFSSPITCGCTEVCTQGGKTCLCGFR